MHHVIAHVDMDCFFAACELKRNPHLKGLPLVIGGSKRGVVSTCSYEARTYGIHSAMPSYKAKQLCPHAVFLPPDGYFYATESKKVMAVLQTFTDTFEQASIDEAYLDISNCNDWLTYAREIRKTILEKTGYTCSIGVAISKKIAKIGSGYKKPSGITIIKNKRKFMNDIDLKQIPGIGKKSLPYFTKLGLKTGKDLAQKDIFFVLDHFGKHGVKLYNLVRGEDNSKIVQSMHEKSISHESTYADDLVDESQMLEKMRYLATKVHKRLHSAQFKTVSIKIRFSDFKTITRDFSYPFHQKNYAQILQAIKSLFFQLHIQQPIRLIGVKLGNLTFDTAQQTSLEDFSHTTTVQNEYINNSVLI